MQYRKIAALFLAFALLAAACGNGDDASTTGADGTEQVFFILDWVPKGQSSPFYVALDKGFWAERGLAVQLTRGYGSGDTAQRVGLGEGDFGYADAGVVMNTISQGLPLVEIAAIASTNPVAAYIDPAAGVTEAADLVGLRGAVDAGDNNDSTFKAWAPSVGISYDDIDWQYTAGANITSVASGQADFVMDWITNLPEWWLADPPIEADSIWIGKDMGVYGNGLITRPEVLETRPEVVQAFIEGAMEGFKYVLEGGLAAQNESIDILFKYNPELAEQPNAREFHLANLQLFLTLMLTDDVREGGLGYFGEEKKALTIEFMNEWLLEGPDVTAEQAFADLFDKGQIQVDDFDGAIASLETVLGRPNPLLPFLSG